MVAPTFFAALLGASMVTACADHSTFRSAKLAKRADYKKPQQADWAYEASFDWGRVNSNYRLCQAGTQQSPIAIGFNNAFTIEHPEGDYSGNPSFTYDNTTVYLSGWHIHTPADHTVSGWRSRAEMHFVHVNEKGTPSAVLAFRLDPSSANDEFFAQMPPMIGFNETDKSTPTELDLNLALKEVSYFGEFWTYQGSLTSPPCTEGIRWFVARNVMFLGDEQLSAVLGASTYSARAEQQVWRHKINE